MKTRIYHLLAFVLFSTTAFGQVVVAVEAQDMLQAAALNPFLPIRVEYDVQNYKVVYTTVDAFGQPDTASGLLTLPLTTENSLFPLAVYNHGTVGGNREGVLSRMGVQERTLAVVIGATGYITVSPDYIGLGDSDGRHPYVHAKTEASAGRDMLIAVRKWLTEQNIGYTDQLFITGYSQGGHATAALHRDIETNRTDDGLDVTSATYLSGPYSISDIMVSTIFQEGNATLPGYIAYTYISYDYVYGLFDSLAQAFVDPYLPLIQAFADQETTLGEFNLELDALLQSRGDRFNAIFQDSIREILRVGDPSEPINAALLDNDTYDWATNDPTLIYYCTLDEQVPFANAFRADSVMRANGSAAITLESGGPLTHNGCVIPALSRTLEFWAEFAEVVSLGEPVARTDLRLFPNPVSAGAELRLTGEGLNNALFAIYDVAGRTVAQGNISTQGTLRLPNRIGSGLHLLRIGLDDGTSVIRRVLVR
jgi:hypothetical protein